MNNNRLALLLALAALGCQVADETASPYQGVVEFEELSPSFEYGGKISRLLVQRGQLVEAGQVLAEQEAELDEEELKAKSLETRASGQDQNLLNLGPRPHQLQAARQAQAAAEAQLRHAEAEFERETRLHGSGAQTEQVLVQRRFELEQAQAALAQRKAEISDLLAGARAPERERAALKTQSLESQLAEATLRKAKRQLLAPARAWVDEILHKPGEVVSATTPVLALTLPGQAYVELYVPEEQLVRVQLGTEAQVWVDGRAAPFKGKVSQLAHKAEFTPRFVFSPKERKSLMFRVRVDLEDPAQVLHAGLPVRASLKLASLQGHSS